MDALTLAVTAVTRFDADLRLWSDGGRGLSPTVKRLVVEWDHGPGSPHWWVRTPGASGTGVVTEHTEKVSA